MIYCYSKVESAPALLFMPVAAAAAAGVAVPATTRLVVFVQGTQPPVACCRMSSGTAGPRICTEGSTQANSFTALLQSEQARNICDCWWLAELLPSKPSMLGRSTGQYHGTAATLA
jgi:hypothetical protein